MIDKSYRGFSAIYCNASNGMVSVAPGVNVKQCVAVDYGEILNFETFNTVYLANHLVMGFLNSMIF